MYHVNFPMDAREMCYPFFRKTSSTLSPKASAMRKASGRDGSNLPFSTELVTRDLHAFGELGLAPALLGAQYADTILHRACDLFR